jgi:hypothetical protein
MREYREIKRRNRTRRKDSATQRSFTPYGDSLNPLEAEALVTTAQLFMRRSPQRSLEIVAMNKPQQELIQKMMDDLFASDIEAAETHRARWDNTPCAGL